MESTFQLKDAGEDYNLSEGATHTTSNATPNTKSVYNFHAIETLYRKGFTKCQCVHQFIQNSNAEKSNYNGGKRSSDEGQCSYLNSHIPLTSPDKG